MATPELSGITERVRHLPYTSRYHALPLSVALRGAVPVSANTREAIHEATLELCLAMDKANWGVLANGCFALWITATRDLTAAFPAEAVRLSGIAPAAGLLCAQEMEVDGAMMSIIRIMAMIQPGPGFKSAVDVYIREAAALIESPQPAAAHNHEKDSAQ